MKEGKLIINGKKYKVHLSDEDILSLEKPQTGYERVGKWDSYFRQDFTFGSLTQVMTEGKYKTDDENYKAGNYYCDINLAKNNARADNLMRRLRRWQALNDEPVGWCGYSHKYYIYYNYEANDFTVCRTATFRHIGNIYFSSAEKAQEAIEVFRDELTWYFTEYQQRLDEPKRS